MTEAQPLESLSGRRLVAVLEKRFDTVIEDVPVGNRVFSILRPKRIS